MGISSIGEFAALPEDLLKAVFGIYRLYLWKRAHGEDSDLHLPEVESKSISREITLEQDTVDEEYLSSVLHLLIEKAANELRKTRRKTKTITLKLRYTDLKRVSRAVTLDKATNL